MYPNRLILKTTIGSTEGAPGFGATVIGREVIETPAGTFNAWVFHDEYELGGGTWLYREESTCWFVPYVGIAKAHGRIATTDLYTGDVDVHEETLLELQHYTIATP